MGPFTTVSFSGVLATWSGLVPEGRWGFTLLPSLHLLTYFWEILVLLVARGKVPIGEEARIICDEALFLFSWHWKHRKHASDSSNTGGLRGPVVRKGDGWPCIAKKILILSNTINSVCCVDKEVEYCNLFGEIILSVYPACRAFPVTHPPFPHVSLQNASAPLTKFCCVCRLRSLFFFNCPFTHF